MEGLPTNKKDLFKRRTREAGQVSRQVCVVITARASYGRIKSVLEAIRAHPKLRLQIIVCGSALLYRHGRINEYLEKDGFEIDQECYSVVEGSTPTTMALSTGLLVIELTSAIQNLNPDIVLTIADRHETMATAIASTYLNTPLAHLQGGEVSGSIDESVRHAITKLAHVHFPATERARNRIISMGEDPENVFKVGCPSIDLVRKSRNNSPDLSKYSGIGPRINIKDPFILVLQHPVTTEFVSALTQIKATLEAIHELGIQTIWLSPNVDAGGSQMENYIRRFREQFELNVCFYRSFEPQDFYALLDRCAVFIGNSSSAVREGAFLGTPSVNLGTRQAGREYGNNIVCASHNVAHILKCAREQMSHGKYVQSILYGNGTAGRQIAEILANHELIIQKQMRDL